MRPMNAETLLMRHPVKLHDGSISVVSIYDGGDYMGDTHFLYVIRVTHKRDVIFSALQMRAPKTVAIDNEQRLKSIALAALSYTDKGYTEKQNDFIDTYYSDFVTAFAPIGNNPGDARMTEFLTDPITKRQYYRLEGNDHAPRDWYELTVTVVDKIKGKYEQRMAFETEHDAHLVLSRWNDADMGKRTYMLHPKGA